MSSVRNRVYVIAEAGVNHNGQLDLALRLVDVAAEAGADAVKFQTFRADRVVTTNAPKAEYQLRSSGSSSSQLEMLRALELDETGHRAVQEHCRARGIEFLSTPFDRESVDFLVDGLGLDRIKIPSGEIDNGPLLLHIARKRRPVILSTGMSTLEEVQEALSVLAFGFVAEGTEPGREAFQACYASPEGRRAVEERVVLLHCTSEYPAPIDEVNLRCMDTLAARFDLPVGLSDHSEGIAVAIGAAARGAVLIEKHFTLSRSMEGPDHAASLEPTELAEMVAGIRAIERALGTGVKEPTPGEVGNRSRVRRSLYAAGEVKAGALLEPEDIAVLRPGGGTSPMEYWSRLGTPADRAYAPGEPLS